MVLQSTNWRAFSATPNRDLGLSVLSLVHPDGNARAAAIFTVLMGPSPGEFGAFGAAE
jgi:hypothetical protein